MGDDTIYTDGSPELFDAASDLMMNKYFAAKKIKDQQIYDLALKALDYYREYLQQNQPFDHTTGTYISSSPVYKPKVDDIVDCHGNMVGTLPSVKVSCDPSKSGDEHPSHGCELRLFRKCGADGGICGQLKRGLK